MAYSRTKYTLINFMAGIGVKTMTLATSFLIRTVFIRTLGIQYTGISTLFTDILMVLSFAELGIGTAITYALYKPIAEKDEKRILLLMNFYKRVYRVVALAVLVLGMGMIPFLKYIVNDIPDIKESIYLIYILYILNSSCSYLLIYKSTLLSASQCDYMVSKIKIWVSIIKSIIECLILFFTHNFIVYLVFNVFIVILQNIIISKKSDEIYPFLKNKVTEKLPKEDIKKLFKDVKALFMYKISGVVLNSTDSIVISGMLGTGIVGIVSNYKLISNQVYSMLMQFFGATTASIGNLATTDGDKKQYEVFKVLLFFAFCSYSVCTTAVFVLINPFIKLWLGNEFLLNNAFIVFFVIDFYITGLLSPITSFRTSNGLFVQGQYRPVIMAVLNIVISIWLAKLIGVTGVIVGTVVSRVLTQLWYDPWLIYKNVFHVSIINYIKKYLAYGLITAGSCVFSWWLSTQVNMSNLYVDLVINGIICLIVPAVTIVIVYGRSYEFKYLLTVIKKLIKK